MTWIGQNSVPAFTGSDLGTIVHKFGSAVLGTSFGPVARGGLYQMLQPAAATALRVKAGNAADTAAGNGARTIVLEGLDETGAIVTPTLTTAGASASTATTETFIRLYRAYVATSGLYANTTGPVESHAADIVIENGGGGTDWLTIDSTDYAKGQSEVACYSVPTGKTAYLSSYSITIDSGKTVDLLFMVRESILDAAAPYQAMREKLRLVGLDAGQYSYYPRTGNGPYTGPCDLIWMGKGASSPDVSIDYEIVLL